MKQRQPPVIGIGKVESRGLMPCLEVVREMKKRLGCVAAQTTEDVYVCAERGVRLQIGSHPTATMLLQCWGLTGSLDKLWTQSATEP